MAVNIFGSGPKNNASTVIAERGQPGVGFKYLDSEGNFDMNYKRLGNLGDPIDGKDVVHKEFLEQKEKILAAKINNVYDEMNHEYAGLSVAFQNLKTDLDVDLRHNSDRFSKIETDVNNVRNAIEIDVAAKLNENDNLRDIETEKKMLEQRVYIDELIAGLRTYTSNEVETVTEDFENLKDIISGVTDDVRVNSSEIEISKANLDILKRKLNDLNLNTGTSDVVNTTIAGLDEKVRENDIELRRLIRRIGDDLKILSNRDDTETTEILERIESFSDAHNRLIARVEDVRNTAKTDLEAVEGRVNALDSTDPNSVSSKLFALIEKFDKMEERVNRLVGSNIEMEERLRPFMRRRNENGIL